MHFRYLTISRHPAIISIVNDRRLLHVVDGGRAFAMRSGGGRL